MAINAIRLALTRSNEMIAKATVSLETRLGPQSIVVLHKLIDLAIRSGRLERELSVQKERALPTIKK